MANASELFSLRVIINEKTNPPITSTPAVCRLPDLSPSMLFIGVIWMMWHCNHGQLSTVVTAKIKMTQAGRCMLGVSQNTSVLENVEGASSVPGINLSAIHLYYPNQNWRISNRTLIKIANVIVLAVCVHRSVTISP